MYERGGEGEEKTRERNGRRSMKKGRKAREGLSTQELGEKNIVK
jgi:hypothetical protein